MRQMMLSEPLNFQDVKATERIEEIEVRGRLVYSPTLDGTAILDRLFEMVDSESRDAFACITARREHGVKSVDVEQPRLAIILRGKKQVRCGAVQIDYAPGDLFLMTTGCRLDVVNLPDPVEGLYLTVAIPFCDEVIAAARLLWARPVTQSDAGIAKFPLGQFERELSQWADAMTNRQYVIARLALAALAVRLCDLGYTNLLVSPPPSLTARVRALVSGQPDRDWQSRDFEHEFGMSGATLRRRLATEQTNLRDVIRAARLACALDLLYTTRWPVKTIAAKVGYRSTPSFVHKFTERYGLEPAQIGNA